MMPNDRLLTPHPGQKSRDSHKFIAADIETDGLGGDYLYGAAWVNGEDDPVYFDDAESMLKWFLSRKYASYTMGFHNLDYDFRYFLELLIPYTEQGFTFEPVTRRDERLIAVVIRHTEQKRKWIIADTYALMPSKLANLANLAGMPKLNIGLAENVTFDKSNPHHVAYLRRDVEMLKKAYIAFSEQIYEAFQIYPSLTAGSTAIKAIRRNLPGAFWRQRNEVEDFCRKAMFGGLTFLRSTRKHEDCTLIDANAMYAWAMRQGVPVGSGTYTSYELPDLPGVYRCTVSVSKEIPFTFVPVRTKNGIHFPTGTFETHLATPTIEAARQRGYQIIVHEGYVFDEIKPIFDGFVEQCERIEMEHKGTALGDAIKILRNSGYGKFAQGKTGRDYLIADELPDEYTPVIDEVTGELNDHLGYIESERSQSHMMIVWGLWITSHARIHLTDAVYAIGPHHVINGDTDSITANTGAVLDAINRGVIEISKQYGDWKIDKTFVWFRPQAPKNYLGITVDGKQIQRSKGTPLALLSFADHERAGDGETVSIDMTSVNKPLAMMKDGKPSAQQRKRTVSNIANSPGWFVENGAVYPRHIEGTDP